MEEVTMDKSTFSELLEAKQTLEAIRSIWFHLEIVDLGYEHTVAIYLSKSTAAQLDKLL